MLRAASEQSMATTCATSSGSTIRRWGDMPSSERRAWSSPLPVFSAMRCTASE
jgi:hypothetical protein